MTEKSVAVIGSGFGGLSTAIRLMNAGFQVKIFEKGDQPGGRAMVYRDKGFVFDAGPTVITAPLLLDELFEEAGKDSKDYVEMLPVAPFYQLCWEDGYRFDYSSDLEKTKKQIREKSPEDVKGYEAFLEYTKEVFDEGYTKLADKPFLKFWDMVRVSPQLIKLQAFRSVYSMVSKYIKDEQLRQAFSFHSLLVGGNPFSTSSIYTLIHYLEREWGVFYPRGGTGSLVSALVKLFQEGGGEIALSSPVKRIITSGDRVTGIETENGEKEPFDAVVSNADVVHTYKNLLGAHKRGQSKGRRLARSPHSMSLFLIYFGTDKKYPEIAHHSVLFGPRYRELLRDIFKKGELAEDFSLYLHAPTRTDPRMAPEGCEGFYVLAPVPHLGKADLDWGEIGKAYSEKILEYLEEQCLPGLRKHLVTKRIFTPKDFKTTYNAHMGSAFSLAVIAAKCIF
jgi:phytoene desaturase